jgi:uncharacterized SAM-binding protein YcdF (DUF218 family)
VGSRRGFILKSLIVLVALAAVLYLSSGIWLAAIGRALVYDEGPVKADAAVVLAGDLGGARLIGGAELVKKGYVPIVIVSGPPGPYDVNEADAAVQFALNRGYSGEWFAPIRHTAMSTHDEAQVLLKELKRRQARNFILVTSNYHTRRARRIFLSALRRNGGGMTMHVMAVPDRDYDPACWWKTRQGWKVAFFEWTKTVTSLVGI